MDVVDAAVLVDVHAVEAEADDERPNCTKEVEIKTAVGGRAVISY